jgi:hypothetical protein
MMKWIVALGVAVVLAAPALADNVGPGPMGYRMTNAVPLTWEDISSTGTRILAGIDDDVTYVPDIGFGFKFMGITYRDMTICSNGHVAVGQNYDYAYSNYTLPSTDAVPGTVYAFWDDLKNNRDADYYETRGTPGYRRFIVQWNNVDHYSSTTSGATFSATFFEATGYIGLQYHNMNFGDVGYNYGASATVGVQLDATSGLQWSYNTAAVTDGTSLLITPEPATLSLLALGGLGLLARRKRARA